MKRIMKSLSMVAIFAIAIVASLAIDSYQGSRIPHSLIVNTREVTGIVITLPTTESADAQTIEQSNALSFTYVKLNGINANVWAIVPSACEQPKAGELVVVEYTELNATGTVIADDVPQHERTLVTAIRCDH